MKKLMILFIVAMATTFTVFAETLTVETVTEALNYSGDKAAVTKLIITGQISGNDYSDESEWSKFYNLNETFPNIEAVEILTDQDIPDADTVAKSALFSFAEDDIWRWGGGARWLKHFSAPNVKVIGSKAFANCSFLKTVDFPVATIIKESAFTNCSFLEILDFPRATDIGISAFNHCYYLNSINFPVATTIKSLAFNRCDFLTSVSFGTGFTEPTEIYFDGYWIFGIGGGEFGFDGLTRKIDLTLGEYVLPAPNLIANTWQNDKSSIVSSMYPNIPYIWKSIAYTSIDEIIKNRTVSIFPNPTVSDFTVSFDLEKSCNMQILLCDILGSEVLQFYDGFASAGNFTRTFSTENLAKGIYFLKILADGNSTVEKIIVE